MKSRIERGVIIVLALTLAGSVSAGRLLTEEKAIAKMFPGADEILRETLTLEGEALESVKTAMGGKLVEKQRGSESAELIESHEFTFIYALKGGEKVGVALIEEQPGKWGPVEYIIALDPHTAKVVNLAVMSYSEKRGRPIARRNFLKQFVNKGSANRIQVKKDIRAISGATISSAATCFAVRKVITLYEIMVLKAGSRP